MGFEVVQPGLWTAQQPLGEGQASLGRDGALSVRAADLAKAGITDRAIVLADRETFRLGLRAPRKGEEELSVPVRAALRGKNHVDIGRRRVNLNRGVRAVDLEVSKIAGRYMLTIKGTGSEAVLIIGLVDVSGADVRKAEQQKKKHSGGGSES